MIDDLELVYFNDSYLATCCWHSSTIYRWVLLDYIEIVEVRGARFINMLSHKHSIKYYYLPHYYNKIVVIKIMSQIEVLQNAFDKSTLRTLTGIVHMTNFDQPRNKIGTSYLIELSSFNPCHQSSISGRLPPILLTMCSTKLSLQPFLK